MFLARPSRWVTIRRLTLLSALVLSAACDNIGQAAFSPCSRVHTSPMFQTIDSAGVTIRVTACEAAQRPLDWTIDPQPALELGRGSDTELEFYEIRGVASLPGGRLAVIDLGTRQLRYFDSRGHLLFYRGRKGSGPGEFEGPSLIPAATHDSLVVFDTRSRRFTSFTADGTGEAYTLSTAAWLPGSYTPLGVIGDEILIRRAHNDYSGFGMLEQDVRLLWARAGAGTERELLRDRVAWVFRVRDEANDMIYGCDPPFATGPIATVTKTGAAVTTGKRFEVLGFDTAGALTRILRVDRRRQPVRPADYEGYVELRIQQGRGSEGFWSHLSDVPLPDSMPAFSQLLVDDGDWVWAKISEWDTRKAQPWMVFDPEGRAGGIVELPAGLQVWHIGYDFILGTSEDSTGVEIVRRYTLKRTDEARGSHTSN